jgi:hypothetical protein
MVEREIQQIIPIHCPCGYDDCSCCMHSNGNVEDGIVACYYDEEELEDYDND